MKVIKSFICCMIVISYCFCNIHIIEAKPLCSADSSVSIQELINVNVKDLVKEKIENDLKKEDEKQINEAILNFKSLIESYKNRIECTKNYRGETDAEVLAKTMNREAGGFNLSVPQAKMEVACVGWTILNAFDTGRFGQSITAICNPDYVAYNYNTVIREDLLELATDILIRWYLEKDGYVDIGRVLPDGYVYFYGDGLHNYFRNVFNNTNNIWDYSLNNPYANVITENIFDISDDYIVVILESSNKIEKKTEKNDSDKVNEKITEFAFKNPLLTNIIGTN